jgi:hypothetical protein
VWFDVSLAEPYRRFTIDDPADTETTVLPRVLGVRVSAAAVLAGCRCDGAPGGVGPCRV